MTAILVDTDILIEVLRERDASVLAEWRRLAMDDQPILYSPVTATELWHGARKKEETTIRTLLSTMICVPIDEEIGRRAGEFLRTFRASHGVELADALIGATAALHGCMLWTRYRTHYPMKEVGLY